jgi:archaellum component FlaC
VKSINQSIHSHLDSIDSTLNSIQGDLSQIKGNLTEIKAILQEINSTTYLISGKIDSLSLDLASINASLISYIGTSLNGLETNLTTLIISVNSTVVSSNATIMNKLYGIQGEIANMTDTIVNNLLNITNITANITLSQQEVMNTMVALYGNQAKNRNFAYLGVGITGLLAGGDSGAVQYCKDNMTLATYSVQNVSGSINMTNVFEDLTRCTYGCVKDACVIPQYMIWLYVLIALIGVFVVYLWFERIGWMSGE